MVNPIINLLNKPFPEQESSFGAPKTIAIVSLFVTFFLYVFEPFGIGTLESGKFLVCLGFGAMTFLGSSVYEFVVGRIFKLKGELENWTLGNWIVNNLGVLLTISLANFLFARLALFGYMDWELFPHMLYGTFMVGIIPVIALGAYTVLRQEKKYQNIARTIHPVNAEEAKKKNEDGPYLFEIPVSRVKYVQGLQNYVSIGYMDEDGQFRKKTERAALKHILDQLSGSPIMQSHRSFLVNRNAVVSASGNAQGLLLELSQCDRTVPVSRSYVPVFREVLR